MAFDPVLSIGGVAGGDALGQYQYLVDIANTAPNNIFDSISLSHTGSGAFSISKIVYDKDSLLGGLQLGNSLTANHSTLNLLLYDLRSIFAIGQYSILTGQGMITDISQTITEFHTQPVPGPLPLMGAEALFGFSRRLRQRSRERFSRD